MRSSRQTFEVELWLEGRTNGGSAHPSKGSRRAATLVITGEMLLLQDDTNGLCECVCVRERFLGKCCFWWDCRWLEAIRSATTLIRCHQVRIYDTKVWEHVIKTHAVYTMSNDPLLDPAWLTSSACPSIFATHSTVPFHAFRYLPLQRSVVYLFLSVLTWNILLCLVRQYVLIHDYPCIPSLSISPYGVCHLTCLQSPLTVRKPIQPVILHAHCS